MQTSVSNAVTPIQLSEFTTANDYFSPLPNYRSSNTSELTYQDITLVDPLDAAAYKQPINPPNNISRPARNLYGYVVDTSPGASTKSASGYYVVNDNDSVGPVNLSGVIQGSGSVSNYPSVNSAVAVNLGFSPDRTFDRKKYDYSLKLARSSNAKYREQEVTKIDIVPKQQSQNGFYDLANFVLASLGFPATPGISEPSIATLSGVDARVSGAADINDSANVTSDTSRQRNFRPQGPFGKHLS